jgi:ABC-2 type transport system permease protein
MKVWKTLLKLFRLWRLYAYMDFLWLTRDFKFFVINYLADLVISLSAITLTFLIAERFSGIGGWSKAAVIWMLGYGTTVRGISNLLFGFNVLYISRRLGRGQLDHSYFQPQPLWVTFLTEGFNPCSGSGSLAAGIFLLVWSSLGLGLVLSWDKWLRLLLDLGLSVITVLLFSFFWGSLAFWAPRGAEEISSSAVRLMERLNSFPLDGIGPMFQTLMITLLPVGLTAWWPARYLLGIGSSAPWRETLWMAAVAAILALAVVLLFQRGLRQYEKYGSSRYHSWGHRS